MRRVWMRKWESERERERVSDRKEMERGGKE